MKYSEARNTAQVSPCALRGLQESATIKIRNRQPLWPSSRLFMNDNLSLKAGEKSNGLDVDIPESGGDSFQPLQDCRFGLYADDAVQLSASFKQQQGRNALDTETCRRGRIFVYIEFSHAHAARHFRGQFLDHRRHHPARSAPRRPHVEQHRQRRALDLGRKVSISDRNGFNLDGQGCLAAATHGTEPLTNLFQWDPIGSTAGGTPNQLRIRHLI